ncbi:cytochrome-c oxidase, cbb3-type subunit II [Paracoccus sp. (in: a-proteobacteria)]|uniref:cytochrome-c oxidase, cbb3-type subunit II n=1 Tax=Paracoccus sp. TaxID=267 RepID=UPI0032205A79
MPILKLHYNLEKLSLGLVVGIIVAASVGGIVEIAPLFTIENTVDVPEDMRPYTPLELAGREIYMREGCYACHSQMIRTLTDDIDRFGPYSVTGESVWDFPMLWGSKRTGPDIARLGGKYSDAWHVLHMLNPRDVVPTSIMPAYPWLTRALDTDDLSAQLATLARLGVPYSPEMIRNAGRDALAQTRPDGDAASDFAERYGERPAVRSFDGDPGRLTEMDALVAYLQSLGQLTDVAHKTADEEES